jgi:hypothetical protein
MGKEMASMKEQIKEGTIINLDQVHQAMVWPFCWHAKKKDFILILKTKQVNNPEHNIWNSTKTKALISGCGLEAGDNRNEWVNVYAVKGFHISRQHSRKNNNFPGTIVYYYEIIEIDHPLDTFYGWVNCCKLVILLELYGFRRGT